MNKHCNYEIFQEYINEETQGLAIEHAAICEYCFSKIMHIDASLAMIRDNKNKSFPEDGKMEYIGALVDKYMGASSESRELLLNSFIKENNRAAVQLFLDLLYFKTKDNQTKTNTVPLHLKNFVMESMDKDVVKRKSALTEKIVLRIKNGIEIIGNHLEDLLVIEPTLSATPIRSGVNKSGELKSAGAIQFYINLNEDEKLVYNIVKDQSNSVMLTVKLQNFNTLPKFMNLMEHGKIISTFPLQKDYAYFQRVEPGDYEIQLKYTGNKTNHVNSVIPIQISDK